MKETVKINLAQRLFNLDQDAYVKLKAYLDSLAEYLKRSSKESEEILFDIEQRIAEILTEKLGDKKQVVNLSDIDEVIEKMGTAEDFARDADFVEEDSEPGEGDKAASQEEFSRASRRLYRDAENNILGGVCSGLAAYFKIDSIWIRLAFIVLFFVNLVGLIIYIILWVVVPPATTRSQKLRMQGKPVNIGNIEESVKNEYTKVKNNFKNFSESDGYKKTKDGVNEAAKALGNVFLIFLKIVAVIIGVGLAVAGIALLISLLAALVAGSFWNGWNWFDINLDPQFMHFFQNITFFSLAVFLVILIPVIAILAGIVRLIFNLKRKSGVLSAFAWTFWSLALVFVIITLIVGVNGVSFGYHYKDKVMEIPSEETLYLRLDEENPNHARVEYYTIFGKELIHDKWDDCFLIKPEIEISTSNELETNIYVQYTSLIPWMDEDDAYPYTYRVNDSVVVLDNYWRVDEEDLWRLPRVKVVIEMAESQSIHFDQDFRTMPTADPDGDEWPSWFYKGKLEMEDGELLSLP